MITPRAYLFGFVGSCFYLIALVNTLPPFYYALTWLTAAVLASSLGIALLSLVGVTCEWTVSRTRVSENIALPVTPPQADGDEPAAAPELAGPTIECKVFNNGTLNKTDVLLEVHLHEQWRDETLHRRFLLEALPSGSSISTALVLHDLPRGRYRVTDIRLLGSDVLGLFRIQKNMRNQAAKSPDSPKSADITANGHAAAASEEGEIIVGPAMIGLSFEQNGQEAGAGQGGIQSAALMGLSDETRGTRPYVAGDDLRFVHWKSTARHGQLVVREFDRSSQRQAVIVWDGAAGTDHGEGEFSSAEQGLRLTASLCRAFFEQSQPCGLLRLDSHPLWVPPAGSGLRHSDSLAGITEALADAGTGRELPLLNALSSFAGNLKAGTDLFLVTASLSPSVGQTALWARARGLHVVIGLIDGASFLKASEAANRDATNDLLWRPVLQGRVPQEHWEAGADGAGATVVNNESYRAQENRLREHGIPLTTLLAPALPSNRPTADSPPDPQAFLRHTLREMLELRRLTGAAGGVPARTGGKPLTGGKPRSERESALSDKLAAPL